MAARYKYITAHGHPNAYSNGQVQEHVFVMSEMLGRPLTDLEVVHHIDEDKKNNAPTNLQLFATKAEHNTHHRHLRALKACGNPDFIQCRHCGIYDDPNNMSLSKVQTQAWHKSCAAKSSATQSLKSLGHHHNPNNNS